MLKSKTIIDIYLKGIENLKAVYPNYIEKGKPNKTIKYYLVDSLISPYKTVSNVLFFIHVKNHRTDNLTKKFSNIVYRGNWFYSLKEFRKEITFVSPLSRVQRLYIWIKAFSTYKNEYESFAMWLDYNFLYAFLEKVKPTKCVARNHFDELATWLGGLSNVINYEFEIYQHGMVLDDVKIPHKIRFSKVNVFDSYSEKIFRKNYISNSNCQVEIYQFGPSVSFNKLDKDPEYKYVGIVEQKDTEWVKKIISSIRKFPNLIPVIMMHPLSVCNYDNTGAIVTNEKYSNLDAIITSFSTLAIDYKRAKISTPIISTSIDAKEALGDYIDYWANNSKELENILKVLLQE